MRVGGHIAWGDLYNDPIDGLVEVARESDLVRLVGQTITKRGFIYRK